MPFSDSEILIRRGTLMAQTVVCSGHCTKDFAPCFSSVAHGASASASPGRSLERLNVWGPHPRPSASESACDKLSYVRSQITRITVREALLSHFISDSSPQPCTSRCRVTKLIRGEVLFTRIWSCFHIQLHPSLAEA